MGASGRSNPAALVALGGAAGLFVGQATTWWKEDPNDWRFQLLLPLLTACLVALVATILVFGARRLRSSLAAPASLLVASVASGLLAAAPVGLDWNDGCNSHDARVPLLVAPVAALVKPEKARLSYDEVVTLAACLPIRPFAQPR